MTARIAPRRLLDNLPATLYNYRNDEYMLNQGVLTVSRPTHNGGCGWDVGGHMDLLYGTNTLHQCNTWAAIILLIGSRFCLACCQAQNTLTLP